MNNISYTWEDYASDEEKSDIWINFYQQMKDELIQWYGLQEPDNEAVYCYTRKRVDQLWHEVGMLDFLYNKSGRLQKFDLTREELRIVCEFHLEGCLQNSFHNCDLYEGKYSELDKNSCNECGDSLLAGDYEKYCKYCWNYRNHST
jgi:hypothetical protein